MDNAIFSFPKPINEPVKAYAPGSSEKASLKKALAQLSSEEWDIPLVIGGKEIRTGIRRPALFGNRYTEPYGISCFGRFCVLAHAVQLYLYCF